MVHELPAPTFAIFDLEEDVHEIFAHRLGARPRQIDPMERPVQTKIEGPLGLLHLAARAYHHAHGAQSYGELVGVVDAKE